MLLGLCPKGGRRDSQGHREGGALWALSCGVPGVIVKAMGWWGGGLSCGVPGEIVNAIGEGVGAAWALSCGVPAEIVKALGEGLGGGDWRSTAYLCYVDKKLQTITDSSLSGNSLTPSLHEWILVLTAYSCELGERMSERRRGKKCVLGGGIGMGGGGVSFPSLV